MRTNGHTVYDVIIIGAGVVGSSLARRLSAYSLEILVLESADDVGSGATRANSGIIHGGYAAKAGTRKAELSVKGNQSFDRLNRDLNFGFKRIGSVVLSFSPEDDATLEYLLENGVRNGVSGLEIVGSEEVIRRMPRVSKGIRSGLLCSEAGIASPYEFCIALMENAVANGVTLKLNSPLTEMAANGDLINVEAGGIEYTGRYVVNAAGLGGARVAALSGPPPFQIHPRKGQYIVFRRGASKGLDTVVFQPPTEKGKGILVTPTVWGNLLVGPDAQEIQDPEDLGTDAESLARIMRTASLSIADLDPSKAIRVFSGLRSTSNRGDFVIEWSEYLPGLLHLGGIDSPGLTASPAIADKVLMMLGESGMILRENPDFQRNRRGITSPGPLGSVQDAARAAELPEGNPARIVCRCEQVSEGIIRDALAREIPIVSSDAVKRRTRAGMGACQGSFCGSRVRKLVARAADIDEADVIGPSRNRERVLEELKSMRRILADDTGAN